MVSFVCEAQIKYSSLVLMAFDILAAVLSSGWGCANVETEAWKDLTCSAEEREGGREARRRGEKAEPAAGLSREAWERTDGRRDLAQFRLRIPIADSVVAAV